MRTVRLFEALLGLALLAAIPIGGRGVAPIVTALQVAGSLGLLAAAFASTRTSADRQVDLWG